MARHGTSKKRGYVVNKQKHSNISHSQSQLRYSDSSCVFRWAKIIDFVCSLPANFPAAITVVQHLDPNTPANWPKSWTAHTREVKQAEVGDILLPGMVYIAAPTSTC